MGIQDYMLFDRVTPEPSIDDVNNPTVTLKCVGHQWYWSYEYSDYNTVSDGAINYDSYMKVDDEEF